MQILLALRERPYILLRRQMLWLPICLFLLITRLLLTIPAMIGAAWNSLGEGFQLIYPAINPYVVPGLWMRWDSGYYINIAINGYSYYGEDLGFFPAYPLLMRLFSASTGIHMLWSGFLISNLSFIIASILLWNQIRIDFTESIAWDTIITMSVFPTSFFFTAIYTESLFLLFSVLVYWYTIRKRYYIASILVTAVSLTRMNGLLLIIIPVTEILLQRSSQKWIKIILTTAISTSGLISYSIFLWFTHRSPIAFIHAQQVFMKRSITIPGKSIIDTILVIATGQGGFRNNWFMRIVSIQDLLATLLFIICTLLSFMFIRKTLALYLTAAIFMLLVSHGPYTLGLYAISRYVLVLFPGFITIAILINKNTKIKWATWTVMWIILCCLTAWFTSGRWVA